jgi:glycine cleavage system H protein
MSTPQNLRYAASHEWLELETGRVGITDHAQNALSDVVFVEPPKVGRQVKAKEAIAVVESVKAASDIYSPVDGEIVEVNADLATEPALVNTDPYGRGWLFKIRVADPAQAAALHDAAAYAALVAQA